MYLLNVDDSGDGLNDVNTILRSFFFILLFYDVLGR